MSISKEQGFKLLLVLIALFWLFFLSILGAQEYFPLAQQAKFPLSSALVIYGITLFSLPFHFGVGALIWLYGSRGGTNGYRIYCLTGFCWCWCFASILSPAAGYDSQPASQIAAGFTTLSSLFLTVFLYLYPRNFYAQIHTSLHRPLKFWLLWGYSVVTLLFCIASLIILVLYPKTAPYTDTLKYTAYYIYYCLCSFACISRFIVLFWLEKGHTIYHRLLLWAIFFSVGPTFLAYILPAIVFTSNSENGILMQLNPIYTILLFLPLSIVFAYNILRSQLLLDRSMKSLTLFLTWLSSLLGSCVITFFLLASFQSMGGVLSFQGGVLVCLLLIPLICSWMQMFSRKLLQSPLAEIQRELIEMQTSELRPVLQKPDLEEGSLLEEFSEQCWNYHYLSLLFWLDEEHQHFLLAPLPQTHLVEREALLACLLRSGVLKNTGSTRWIELKPPDRPAWLRNLSVTRDGDEKLLSPLVVPVRYADRLIGLLVLAKSEPDAEPDLDIAELLVSHWSLLLEHLRLSEHLYQHSDVFRSLLHIQFSADSSVDEIAQTLAASLAQIFQVSCEIWLGRDTTNEVSPFRGGAHSQEALGALVWKTFRDSPTKARPYFHERNDNAPFLLRGTLAFACLPLALPQSDPLGILILFYEEPHRFTQAERSLLQAVARRVAFLLAATQEMKRRRSEILERTQYREQMKTKSLRYLSHLEQELLGSSDPLNLQEELERWRQDMPKQSTSKALPVSRVQIEALAIVQDQLEKGEQRE